MSTWKTSGYSNGRGAEITFTYTAEYVASSNQTKVTASGYSVTWNTGGQSGTCEISGTFKAASADTPTSSKTLTVSLSTSGSNPTKTGSWSSTFYLDHDTTEDKSIVLSFVGEVNANYYKPTIDDSTTVHVATAQAGTVRLGNGTAHDRYVVVVGNGTAWKRYRIVVGDGSAWKPYS